MRFEFAGERLVRAVGGSAQTKRVNGGITQGPGEPGDDGFVSRGRRRSCDDLGERLLQDVFGERAVSGAYPLPSVDVLPH